MRPSTLGSLLLLFFAGLIAFLWIRGYLTRWLAIVTAGIQTPPALQPVSIGVGTGGPHGGPGGK